jgi:hypothetical protein
MHERSSGARHLNAIPSSAMACQVCRYADGYQPHLVSPENGVRALGAESLDLVAEPVRNCVRSVHTLLINAGR